jgi:hypothetical protein
MKQRVFAHLVPGKIIRSIIMLKHMTNGNMPRNTKKIKDKREMETRRRHKIFQKDSILILGSSNEASLYDSSITSIINLPSIVLFLW